MSFVATLHSFGSFAAVTGSIIAKLKEESSTIHMTQDEETWFGKLSLGIFSEFNCCYTSNT